MKPPLNAAGFDVWLAGVVVIVSLTVVVVVLVLMWWER